MKKSVFAIALAIASMGAAQAQDAGSPKQLYFLVGTGLTFGGDKLATVTYEDLGDYDLRAGGLVAFTAGVDFRVNPQFSLQSTVSYHVNSANASNGDLKFQRFPIELLAYYHPSPKWRVGGGVRYVSSPELNGKGYGAGEDTEYDNTVGAVIETEYLVSQNFGVKVRFVSEKYKSKREEYRTGGHTFYIGGNEYSGNHVGIFGNFYF